MAEEVKKIKVVVEGQDNTSKAFKSASSNASLFEKNVKSVTSVLSKLGAIGASFYALRGVSDFLGETISSYDTQIQQEVKLEHLLKKTTEATDEQVQSLLDQASALQKIGVVGDEVTIALQAQLATFELNTDTIKKMTPAILDMVVAEKGVNATTEDMISFGNAFGMAMEGNYASLTKRGFKLDENTKNIIALGTEEQKATAITKYLTDTYAGLNQQMQNTSQGGMISLQNSFGDFKEQLGEMVSFFRNEGIDSLSSFFSISSKGGEDWSKQISFAIYTVGQAFLTLPEIVSGVGLGIGSLAELLISWMKGDSSTYAQRLKDSAMEMIESAFDWVNLEKSYATFEEKWGKLSEKIITPTSEGGDDPLPQLIDEEAEAEKAFKSMSSSFTSISKDIVSSFEDQSKAINSLRDDLKDLETDTQNQLDSVDARYQEDLKSKARQSKERIAQIEKEIEDTTNARSAGWRTQIAELEAEKEIEKNVLSRINGEVTNLDEELAKDELTILKEEMEAKKALIQEEADKTKAEKESEISSRTNVQLKGLASSLSPTIMDTLISEDQSFLGSVGGGANQYIFTFNGDVNDQDKLIKAVTEALNRQATLRGIAGT